MTAAKIYTIGHSTRPCSDFLALLTAHMVEMVIDIRSIPQSHHNPQFNKEELKSSLKEAGIGYKHLKELGGFRHPLKESLNTGWNNSAFRGFADYMQSDEFQKAIEKLETLALKKRCAIMCAEAVPWRCHRSLIADALTVKKWLVYHIQGRKTAKLHKVTSFLIVTRGMLIYQSR